jgi:predicted phage terminase large subunit-like protein
MRDQVWEKTAKFVMGSASGVAVYHPLSQRLYNVSTITGMPPPPRSGWAPATTLDTPGALWSHGSIEASRLRSAPEMTRVVVAIDPAVTSGEDADETGIVVAGKDKNGHGYVLADISGRYPPTEWARLAIAAYRTHRADRIVAEVNNGGDMVGATLRMIDPNVAFTAVRASRGKIVRAEPVAALYQQGRVHHIGTFPQLEDQMTNFTSDIDRAAAGYSPDRLGRDDAATARRPSDLSPNIRASSARRSSG